MNALKKSRQGLDPLEIRVQRSVEQDQLLIPGSRVLVGVSGGPDSMALLAVLCSLRSSLDLELTVLYCHHGLRAAADQEELFVRQWAQRWNCTFSAERLPVREFQQARKCSLQEAARECRYRALEAQRQGQQARAVALAHTASDQAEEVLIGLIRGAGLGGLAGIPRQRGPFVRPLLGVYREEIMAYLGRRGIPWLEDASNRDLRFLRARVRHHLLPALQQYAPNMPVQLNRLAELLRVDEDFLQEKTREAWALASSGGGDEIPVLSRTRLAGEHQAIGSRLIQTALRRTPGGLAGLGSRHILTLLRLAAGPSTSGSFDLPGNRAALWEKDRFMIRLRHSADRQPRPFSYGINGPGEVLIRETGGTLILKKVRLEDFFPTTGMGNKREALVVWDKIRWPIRVRSLEAGDRFQPLGMAGSKKVARFLMDRKVPRDRRALIPLLWSGGQLVWVAGLEIAQPFAVGADSGAALHLEYREGEKGIEISQ